MFFVFGVHFLNVYNYNDVSVKSTDCTLMRRSEMSSVYRGHKMKNKINAAWFVAMIIVSAVSVFTGCSGRENTQEVQTDESDPDAGKVKIGISFDSFVIERWQQDRDIFVSSA